MIKRLSSEFIPVVGNTHELQSGRSPARDWFMATVAKVKPQVNEGQTAQGFYVVAPDGAAYVFNNNRSVDRVLQAMDKAIVDYKANPPAKVDISDQLRNASFGVRVPSDASVLRIFARVRPLPLGCDSSNENVARDHIWVTAEEGKTMALSGNVPETLALRLARFHFVDNVRGEPDHWGLSDVRELAFTLKRQIEVDGIVTSSLTGHFEMRNEPLDRGLTGTIEGEAAIDKKSGSIKRFVAYCEAQAWGHSTYTPNPPAGKFPMVFAMLLATDKISREVPPQAVFYGNEYLSSKRR